MPAASTIYRIGALSSNIYWATTIRRMRLCLVVMQVFRGVLDGRHKTTVVVERNLFIFFFIFLRMRFVITIQYYQCSSSFRLDAAAHLASGARRKSPASRIVMIAVRAIVARACEKDNIIYNMQIYRYRVAVCSFSRSVLTRDRS